MFNLHSFISNISTISGNGKQYINDKKILTAIAGFGFFGYFTYNIFNVNKIDYKYVSTCGDTITSNKIYKRGVFYLPDKRNFDYVRKYNDQITEKGTIVNGKREGEWYEHTFKYNIYKTYVNDILDEVKSFDLKGRLVRLTKYYSGEIISQTVYNEDGQCTNLPDGEIIVWKACMHYPNNNINHEIQVYVKLRVPKEAKRITPFVNHIPEEHKGRVEYAHVEDIIDKDGNTYDTAVSFVAQDVNRELVYVKGKDIKPDSYNHNPNHNCSHGIHVHLYKNDCDRWW